MKNVNQLIGCCGLDCEKCDARIAKITNNNALREKTAVLWTKLNGVTILPEMINCTGCRIEGAKTPFCDKLCPVHNCVREKGLDMLIEAAKDVQLPVVTELMSADKIGTFLEKKVDLIQIGARNMQNFDLLRAVGRLNVPVLLKRGLSATIDEWLMSAEYIMSEGNQNVILCERGIRTFEKATRNTLDLSAVTVVKRRSHLPVIVDPSHATGHRWMVEDMAMAAIAAGADGIMCEVHNDPEHAWCDGAESITPETFDHLMGRLRQLAPIVGREL